MLVVVVVIAGFLVIEVWDVFGIGSCGRWLHAGEKRVET